MPVLINFHPYERDAAEGIQIPVVDEALTLLLFAIEDPARSVSHSVVCFLCAAVRVRVRCVCGGACAVVLNPMATVRESTSSR